MTDNEKAAHFIGWKPFEDMVVCRCTEERDYHPVEKVAIPAPDMSDPRNYMKALEADLEGWRANIDTPEGLRGIWLGRQGGVWAYGAGLDFAAAVVKALAALYDAERKIG